MGEVNKIETVLVVDDDEKLLACAHRMLGHDYGVFTATTIDGASLIAEREHPDVAIVDLHLGNEFGLDLIRRLRATRPEMLIALLTGRGMMIAGAQATRAGADEVFQKPTTFREILTILVEGRPQDLDGRPTLEDVEWEYIERVLWECNWNISEAAAILGIDRSTLQRKLARRFRVH